jgi:hypothetical protein
MVFQKFLSTADWEKNFRLWVYSRMIFENGNVHFLKVRKRHSSKSVHGDLLILARFVEW